MSQILQDGKTIYKLGLTPRVAQHKRLILETCPFGFLENYILGPF